MAYKKRWNDFFDLFDADGSGFISFADVKGAAENFTKTFGLNKGTKEYSDAIKAYERFFAGFIRHVDANRDGKVAREELSSAVEKIRTADISAAPVWWRDFCSDLFRVVDQNNNGEISLEELVSSVNRVRPHHLSEGSIRQAYQWAIKTAGTDKLNSEAFFKLSFIWGTSAEPNPELDVIFPYWAK